MSNTAVYFILGCEIPDPRYVDQLKAAIARDMRAECRRSDPQELGWHTTYDAHRDMFWFGQAFAENVSNGFGAFPAPPTAGQMAAVRAVWEALPDDWRQLLGAPTAQVLTIAD